MDVEQLNKSGAPIGGRRTSAVRPEAKSARHPLEAGSCGKPSDCAFVVQDNQTLGANGWHRPHAKAKPGGVPSDD
jgi:hypothetical protein